MDNGGFVLLDTSAIDKAIDMKDDILKGYHDIGEEYDRIVNTLLKNWQGKGAAAFASTAKKVCENINGIDEVLKTMIDTLIDIKKLYEEVDSKLGEYNRNPQ